jgi:MFS family permease
MNTARSKEILGDSDESSQKMSRGSSFAFLAAWLGWGFDGLDGFLYALVATRFVKELMPHASMAEVGAKAALIQAVFLVGWAFGGAFFGRVGDRLGRARTLTITILLYAACTGASFFAETWWQLMILRFLAALGIGGEWAAGSSLVAETLPKKYSHWASALLQSGYICGMIGAALTVGALGNFSPRYVFLIGVLPAFFTLWIRRQVPESPAWEGAKASPAPPMLELFKPPVLKTTLMTLGLAGVSLTSVWALLFFSTQVIVHLPEVAKLAPAAQASIVRQVTITYCLWNIAGNFFGSALAFKFGYRFAFTLLFLMSFLSYFLGFGSVGNLGSVTLWLSVAFFFSSGVFALFPLYVPPLFPVLLRTTGSGLTYNAGRLTAAVGTIIGGSLAASAGGPHLAIWYASFLYVPGLFFAILAPKALGHHAPTTTPSIAQ